MKFNIGDKVSFLNEKLDGKIYSIVSSTLVKVETNDGFIIDALASELVLVKKVEVENENIKLNKTVVNEKRVIQTQKSFTYHHNTIQFISAPSEENKLMTGNVNFFIYNCTPYEVMYVLFEQRGREKIFKCKGVLPASNYTETCNYKREDLIDISNFILQIIFAAGSYMHPVVKDIPVVLPSLSNSYIDTNGIKSFAACVEIVNFNAPDEGELIILKDTFKEMFETPLQKAKASKKLNNSSGEIAKRGLLQNSTVIDLHIEELVDNFSGMNNAQIMALQLKKAVEEIENALLKNYFSLILIHGVGNGKLKQALRDELKKYPGVIIRDADYALYGGGATEVLF